jgi:hypothetical protein
LVVPTLQAAEPAPLPAFSTLITTERPPGTETGSLIVALKGPTPFAELPASEARRSTATPIPRKTVPCAWLDDGCASPNGLQRSQSAVCNETGAPQRTQGWD